MEKSLRVGFVIPWYGRDIGGGAETLCWTLVHAIAEHGRRVVPEVFTTTLPGFAEDWNRPTHAEGTRVEDGITVHRFHPTRPRRGRFHRINGARLMPHDVSDLWRAGRPRSPLGRLTERYMLNRLIQTPGLCRRLSRDRTLAFGVLLPYMFGTTVSSARVLGRRALHIPCLHNERYAYMRAYRAMLEEAGGLLYNAEAEQRLAARLADVSRVPQCVLGVIVEVDPPRGDAAAFRAKYGIENPFILYVGRKIAGKGLPELVEHIERMRAEWTGPEAPPELAILGKGDLTFPADRHPGIHDLGFVSTEDKHNAMAAAAALCQPSTMESFSIVVMESWLQGVPVIVPEACEVTADHCRACGGGWIYGDDRQFYGAVTAALRETGAERGAGGRAYVRARYSAPAIVARFESFLETLAPASVGLERP